MNMNDYKWIETSRDDTKIAINEKEEHPEFFKLQMERLEWAIAEIDKLDPATTCRLEIGLIQTRSSYVRRLNEMKEAQ